MSDALCMGLQYATCMHRKKKGRKGRKGGKNLQNSSPASSASPSSAFFCTSRHVHSHSGYSSSASATGSVWFL